MYLFDSKAFHWPDFSPSWYTGTKTFQRQNIYTRLNILNIYTYINAILYDFFLIYITFPNLEGLDLDNNNYIVCTSADDIIRLIHTQQLSSAFLKAWALNTERILIGCQCCSLAGKKLWM